jgi:hypothetical protein
MSKRTSAPSSALPLTSSKASARQVPPGTAGTRRRARRAWQSCRRLSEGETAGCGLMSESGGRGNLRLWIADGRQDVATGDGRLYAGVNVLARSPCNRRRGVSSLPCPACSLVVRISRAPVVVTLPLLRVHRRVTQTHTRARASIQPKRRRILSEEHCKIKRVNPAFRSVSTPRGVKDLPVSGRLTHPSRTK